MAVRPIYHSIPAAPYYEQLDTSFEFFAGFSTSQKQKSIQSLHQAYRHCYPERNPLEISSKSPLELGVRLSAFSLGIRDAERTCPVECAFQGGKVFERGGPFTDLLDKSPKEAKRDVRLQESGKLIAFWYCGEKFPLEPKDFFYNWLYIRALSQTKELADQITTYDSFTDIEFNPKKSINCQARAAAIFVSLSGQRRLKDALASPKDFLLTVYGISP